MTHQLRRGSIADWDPSTADTSMATAIEDALGAQFGAFPPTDPTDRRKLCLAIAHGVLNYLSAHPQAFEVSVETSTHTGTVTTINVV